LINPERLAQWWQPGPDGAPIETTAAPYRRLALQLQHELSDQGPGRSLLLATPSRSVLAAHASPRLAYSLAEELSQRVLLIDASGGDGELSRALGCAFRSGWSDLLADQTLALEPLVLATSHPQVGFLPAGTAPDIASGRHRDAIPLLLERARRSHDCLVLSAGSVLHDTAVLAAAPHVSSVLLMPVENQDLVADLDAAQKALRLCQARHVGVIMIAAAAGQAGRRSRAG
jgi:Mrp family chromosome partitioning ATPase